MKLLPLIIGGIIMLHLNASAQTKPIDSVEQLKINLHTSKPDTNRAALQVKLGSYYLFKPGSYKPDMDSAMRYFNQAIDLSNKLHSSVWKYKTLSLIGNYEFENGHPEKGDSIIKQVATFYHQHNDWGKEADTWETLGQLFYDKDLSKTLIYYQNAEKLYTRAHRDIDLLNVMIDITSVYSETGKLDAAEKEFLLGIEKSNAMPNKPKLEKFEQGLAFVYNRKAMYQQALYYQLKLLPGLTLKKDTYTITVWEQTALTYAYLKMFDKAVYCSTMALANFKDVPVQNNYYYIVLSNHTRFLLAQNKAGAALVSLNQAIKKHAPTNLVQKTAVFRTYAQCYFALKQNKLAGQNFDAMMSNYEQVFKTDSVVKFEINNFISNASSAVDFFIADRQYNKAGIYLKRVLAANKGNVFIASKIRILAAEIKLDSVAGNYKKAFEELSLYKKLNDSIYNSAKSRQIAEMQTKYEASQKEHDIALLESEGKAQNLRLETAHLERNITLGGLAVLLILTALFYNRFRFKQKTNNELEAKQREINLKNESLQQLLYDKDRLITEKDWLVKEVHHRVKNNLHTVICLLELQASYLENDALKAIQISQHRIYAMSLIHQKLYQNDNITTIDMALYLREFIGYLSDSFGTEGNIIFNLDLQTMKMSVVQAIPIALIINEAVTNSIKYAFPDLEKGIIKISLKEEQHFIELIIQDNGVGINPELIDKELKSLGLALIKGLTKEIKGKLTIQNLNGTLIKITFNPNELLG